MVLKKDASQTITYKRKNNTIWIELDYIGADGWVARNTIDKVLFRFFKETMRKEDPRAKVEKY